MNNIDLQMNFGSLAEISSFESVLELIRSSNKEPKRRLALAAYGLSLSAKCAEPETTFFEDTLAVLNSVARAKAEIDIASWHSIHITEFTSSVLDTAQHFVERETIACTEWPLPKELIAYIFAESKKIENT